MALATGFEAANVTQLTPAASAVSSRNQAFLSAKTDSESPVTDEPFAKIANCRIVPAAHRKPSVSAVEPEEWFRTLYQSIDEEILITTVFTASASFYRNHLRPTISGFSVPGFLECGVALIMVLRINAIRQSGLMSPS